MNPEFTAEKKTAADAPEASQWTVDSGQWDSGQGAGESSPVPAPDESVRDTDVNPLRFLSMTTGIGVFFVTMVLLFAGAGWLANRYLGTGGWGMAIAITLGAVAGMYASYLRVGKMLTVLYPENKK